MSNSDLRSAMNKAVKRQKVLDKQRVDPKEAWKGSLKKKRRQRAILALSVLAPLAVVCVLWLLHSQGILRLGTPSQLSRALANPQVTTELLLNNSYLKTLPPEIGTLSALKTLNVGGNSLSTLPNEVGELRALETLQASYNQLETVPDSLGHLNQLVTLDLQDNRLVGLPEEIANLSSLQRLDLSSNQLASIPRQIGNLRNLEELSLRNNQLTTLPDSITSLTALKMLDLRGNPIESLPDLSSLQELKYVNLKGTKISEDYVTLLRESLSKASIIR